MKNLKTAVLTALVLFGFNSFATPSLDDLVVTSQIDEPGSATIAYLVYDQAFDLPVEGCPGGLGFSDHQVACRISDNEVLVFADFVGDHMLVGTDLGYQIRARRIKILPGIKAAIESRPVPSGKPHEVKYVLVIGR